MNAPHALSYDAQRPPRATRSTEGRFVGGVAAGLAQHLGIEVVLVRAVFVVASAVGGLGVALYAGLWMTLPTDARFQETAPGLEAATRQGKRPARTHRLHDVGPLVALSAVGLGVIVILQSVLGAGWVFWPVLLGSVGLAVLWRQADEAQRERWVDTTGRVDLLRAIVGTGGVASYARLAAGLVLLVGALVLFAVQTGGVGVARDVVLAGLLGMVGLGLTVGPWLFRLVGDLSEERVARVRSQERADVAAHLHDSVLQTLALIQKHSADEKMVSRLARAQERDLRAWLYADEAAPDQSVTAALRAAAAEVEDAHGIPVEVVTVGDAPMSEHARPVVLAAREAMVNAAKHAGVEKVDVYAETAAGAVEVFVRDRGCGFDLGQVPTDRLGVRNSILDRMERHGGRATLRSAPGEGTEVRLSMTLETEQKSPESMEEAR